MKSVVRVVTAVVVACTPLAPIAPVSPVTHATLGTFAIEHLPTGADLTVHAAPRSTVLELDPEIPGHPEFRAGYAVSVAVSPRGDTLALLTSGYNEIEDDKGFALPNLQLEWIFFFDVTGDTLVKTQVVPLRNAFVGLAFATDDRLYASGGPDDCVHVLEREGTSWRDVRKVALGHGAGVGVQQGPLAAGIAITPSGDRVVVANHENDSVSVLDERKNTVVEIDLRPGGGAAGGEFPFGVATVGERWAYVVAQRDREIVEIDLDAARVTRRLKGFAQPTRIIATRDGATLFVAEANSDAVAVIDRESFTVTSRIAVGGSPLLGASPNALALSSDERTLFVTLGGANAIARVTLDARRNGHLDALIPTGFYPNDVTPSRDGRTIYCAYGKSVAGPNRRGPWFDDARVHQAPFNAYGGNQFSLQLMRGGLHAFENPSHEIAALLTKRALANEHVDRAPTIPPIFNALRGVVRHVVYVIAENRTFDQILGDVSGLDGDASLVHWGAAITPNQHALASSFAAFDRFFDSGGVSGDGWQWSTAGRSTDVAEKEIPLMYAGRGNHTYDWEGKNRNVNVSLPTSAERHAADPRTPDDPDLLPGQADVAAVDRPREGGPGYLWDVATAAHLRVRNYGVFVDDRRYALPANDPERIPELHDPFATNVRVAFSTALGLASDTDPYFRGFDMTFADFWRAREWQRELRLYETSGDMPELVLVRLPRDHLGQFSLAKDGVDTPDTQIADHDYALGMLVDALSHSRFWSDTIVLALEDDAQNGADHVDAHRSLLFVAGGHAARHVVMHDVYYTPNVLRTIEVLLGLPPLTRRDAVAAPIGEAFTETLDASPFVARVPSVLRSTKLPLPSPGPDEHASTPRGDARSWASATATMRFDHEDEVDSSAFNALLYCRLVGPCR